MLRTFLRFAAVSGTGWLIDVCLTVILVAIGAAPLFGSLIGSAVAVTFVYTVSLRSVFSIDGRLGVRAFPLYLVWQVFSITAASFLVAFLAYLLVPWVSELSQSATWVGAGDPLATASGLSKGLVTPVTLAANFLFFQWLTNFLRNREHLATK